MVNVPLPVKNGRYLQPVLKGRNLESLNASLKKPVNSLLRELV